jgi:hypothetical protein
MPRLLSPAMIHEKNQLQSDHVLSMLFQLDIPGTPAPYRLAHADDDILFHGLPFFRFPVTLDALEDASSLALTRLRITAGNVDQNFQSLLETYWGPDTPWIATIWQVDLMQPDETPFTAGELFTVMQVATDFVSAVVDLQAEGISLSGTIPKRRYTSAGGYPNIPRRLL